LCFVESTPRFEEETPDRGVSGIEMLPTASSGHPWPSKSQRRDGGPHHQSQMPPAFDGNDTLQGSYQAVYSFVAIFLCNKLLAFSSCFNCRQKNYF